MKIFRLILIGGIEVNFRFYYCDAVLETDCLACSYKTSVDFAPFFIKILICQTVKLLYEIQVILDLPRQTLK